MKNRSLIWIVSSLMVLLASIITISCNKKFDEPPASNVVTPDTSITNHVITIKALKMKHTIGGLEKINDSSVIAGIVGGDDESGNLYKQITIQDATGGIALLLDRSGLFTDYPAGRKIYIKCNGLYISDYNDNIELGVLDNTVPSNPAISSIPSSLFDNYIVKGSLGNHVIPKIVTLSQLTSIAGLSKANIPSKDTLQNTLVQINNVEIAASDIGLIYSDTSAAKKSVSRNIIDCFSNTGVIYTSGYANFAGFTLPTGEGNLLGIYAPYKTTAQIVVRDTSDVQFYGLRCGPAVATTLFSETFSGITSKVPITTTGSTNVWQNIAEVGGVSYVGYVSGSNHLASISAYGSSQASVTSWLITQAITIPSATSSPYLTFNTTDGYDNGATFQVLVSTNYNGSSTPSTSTWTALPATIPSGDATIYGSSTPSGNIDLSAYIGKTIYLGWRYDGTSSKTTTFEFGGVKVLGY